MNALADECCFRNRAGRDRRRAIGAEDVMAAREQLVARRETHLDQLADKLQEDRVRRVVEPLLSGGDERPFSARDVEYVRDLGLIARDPPLRIANPVYAEVVPRELTRAAEEGLVQETAWYVDTGGGLDVVKLIGAFQAFFREHSEHWVARFDYREAGPQLLLQAFLHRIVNSGGASSASTAWGAGVPTCSSCGRRASRCGATWSSARCCAGAWSARCARGSRRPRRTWTAARRRRVTWWCSTVAPGGGKTRSSTASIRPAPGAGRTSTCGACRERS